MNAATEKRKALRDELSKIEEKKQQERSQLEKEYEDVALADEIVNKRRNKSARRASADSATSTSTDQPDNKSKVTRRKSALTGTNNTSSNSGTNSNNKNKSNLNDEEVVQTNPIISSPESLREEVSLEPQGIHSSIPPQYQKLLQLGLSQEQVRISLLLPILFYLFNYLIACR